MFRIQENSADLPGKAAACGTGSGKHGEESCETAQVIIGFLMRIISKSFRDLKNILFQNFVGNIYTIINGDKLHCAKKHTESY